MKKLAIALAACAALTGSAFAADIPVRAPVYRAAPMAPRPMTWTGCYIGAGGGYGMYNQELSNETGEFVGPVPGAGTVTYAGRGWFGTVQGGCDYQVASSWVIGVFGDYDFASIKGHLDENLDEKLSSSWAVGGRVGFIVLPNLLTYVSGGYTEARFDSIPWCAGCSTAIDEHAYRGWFIGSGYEYGLTFLSPSLFWKTEYRYASYQKDNLTVLDQIGNTDGGVGGHVDAQKWVQTIRSELVWRFNFGR